MNNTYKFVVDVRATSDGWSSFNVVPDSATEYRHQTLSAGDALTADLDSCSRLFSRAQNICDALNAADAQQQTAMLRDLLLGKRSVVWTHRLDRHSA